MTEHTTTSAQNHMSHGHTRLIWLLDDIEAHLQGLREGSDDSGLILEELLSYVRAFSEELDGHIDEEETDIFPLADSVAVDTERDELEALYDEHRHLEALMRAFWTVLQKICEGGPRERNETCFDNLFERVRSIREHLTAHSAHERTFLSRVEHRLTH